MLRLGLISVLCFITACQALAGPAVSDAQARESLACVVPAARFHGVNEAVLQAILIVESGLDARAVGRNTNGTADLGIGQINSVHFAELKKYGIAPEDLMSPCIGTYVAAWHLAKQYAKYGNTWYAIGAYHSVTPEYKLRYQVRVFEQVRKAWMGVSR